MSRVEEEDKHNEDDKSERDSLPSGLEPVTRSDIINILLSGLNIYGGRKSQKHERKAKAV